MLLDQLNYAGLLLSGDVLQELLHDKPAIGVTGNLRELAQKELDKVVHLFGGTMLDEKLDNAAATIVPRNPQHGIILRELIDDKLQHLRGETGDALLDNVVCMRAATSLPDVASELSG